jgi:protein-S-isoprenylcysteine O-methyltransferase Ste14
MAELALALYGVYFLVAFVLRGVMQKRRTGETGFKGLRPGAPAVEVVAGAGFVVALLAGGAAPALALADVAAPIAALDGGAGHAIGAVLAIGGIAATFAAQVAMGASWRVGVDPGERTDLVTTGPFALVRNPIFSAMLPTALGLTLLVPSWVAIAGLVGLLLALELQVRVVEEPYLRSVHGEAYDRYAARVGRFVPAIGRGTPRAARPSGDRSRSPG